MGMPSTKMYDIVYIPTIIYNMRMYDIVYIPTIIYNMRMYDIVYIIPTIIYNMRMYDIVYIPTIIYYNMTLYTTITSTSGCKPRPTEFEQTIIIIIIIYLVECRLNILTKLLAIT